MTLFARLATIGALAVMCLPLAGCFGDEAKSNEPVPPPILYKVTQHTEDGNKLMVEETATWADYTDGGCIRYASPQDRKDTRVRILCGGLLRVQPIPQ